MPYNADLLQQYQQYPNNLYSNHQFRGPQNAMSNDPVQNHPTEVTVPQRINHQQPVQQGSHVGQPTFPQIRHHPPASIHGQHPPQHGSQETPTHSRHVLGPLQPSVQVEIPSKPAKGVPATPVDPQVLLLFLAEEYLKAAHDNAMLAALAKGEAQMDDYYKLVSTALGCMETVLKRFRLPPLKEAHLRLRFATTLYEETDNDLEAETALSKGIDLCERNKLPDMKYTLQVLLSRVLYRSNPRAATKAIDVIIEDVATYRHVAWEYAFRFLRAMVSLSMHSHQDCVPAVHQLQKIADLAHRRGDHAVFAFASVTEALAHFQSSGPDSVDQAQRALAAARQLQLNEDVNSIPQIQVLVQYIDLCCSLRQSKLEQIGQNLSTMQQIMDQIVDDTNWLDDGSIFLPLARKSVQDIPLTGGDIVQERNGRLVLTLTWLPKKDVYTIGYLLSAVATSQKNAQGDHKAELFLDEGLALVRSSLDPSKFRSEPLPSSMAQRCWREILECQFLLEKAFLLSARSEWEQARNLLNEIGSISSILQTHVPAELLCLARYLAGTICQGTGELNQALNVFRSNDLALPSNCNKTSYNNIRRDIALLAAINTILIIRSPSHPSHHLLPSILSTIDPYLSASPNKHLLASRSLLISSLPQSTHHLLTTDSLSSTLLTKKHLSTALNIAKAIGNAQITAMTLSVMSAKFFKGVVGEQAEKSARAGQNMAYKSGMRLWMSVSNGMLAETLERQGKSEEAGRVQAQALRLAGMMPRALQRSEDDEGAGSVATAGMRKKVAEEEDDDKDELA
jgi:Cohesin loading factor